MLKHFGLEPELVDIDQDPELLVRYGQCVPVVLIDGRLRFRGRVDPRLLRRLLRGPSFGERLANLFRRHA